MSANARKVAPLFSAVLLAGGRSSRMGQDKALLPLADGRPLWRRQLDDVLRPLGPAELWFSGPPRVGLPADARVLADEQPGLGPLSGIAAALDAMSTPLLAALAVDLPAMTMEYFRKRLLPRCQPKKGAAPRGEDGFYEPLAAVYPRECLELAREHLRGGDRSLQSFVRRLEAAGLIEAVEIRKGERSLFTNWNTPADVGPL